MDVRIKTISCLSLSPVCDWGFSDLIITFLQLWLCDFWPVDILANMTTSQVDAFDYYLLHSITNNPFECPENRYRHEAMVDNEPVLFEVLDISTKVSE